MNKLEFNLFNGIGKYPTFHSDISNFYALITTGQLALDRQTQDCKAEYAANGKSDEYTRLKLGLPSATIGGIFEERADDKLTEFSGLYCCDIDGITSVQIDEIKTTMESHDNAIMYYISPSGCGIKVIFRVNEIVDPANTYRFATIFFKNYFDKKFKLQAKQFDTACSNISRIHFLAHDVNAYLNLDAKALTFNPDNTVKEDPITNKYYGQAIRKTYNKEDTITVLTAILTFCKMNKVSITDSYEKWLRLAFFLKDNYDPVDALQLFDEFSKIDPNYDQNKVQQKFQQCVNSTTSGKNISLGTILYYAKDVGFSINFNQRRSYVKLLRKDIFFMMLVQHQIKLRVNTANEKIQRYNWKTKRWIYLNDTELVAINIHYTEELVDEKRSYDYLRTYSPKYRPIQEFLKAINRSVKDDDTDWIKKLAETLKTTDDELSYQMLKKWFLSSVMNLRTTGTFNAYTLVLIGGQGIGKTRWAIKLLPSQWSEYLTSKNLEDNKDDRRLLATYWVIVNDELANLVINTKTQERYKQLSCLDKITDRIPYARIETTLERRANLVGTTNTEHYLRDLTGQRRFFNLKCDTIDHNHKLNMLKVWGYANKLYDAGETPWTENELFDQIEEHNKDFEVESSEEYYINKYYEVPTPTNMVNNDYTGLASQAIIDWINEKEHINAINVKPTRFGMILRKMGYKQSASRSFGRQWLVKLKHKDTSIDSTMDKQQYTYNFITTDENQ